MNSTIIKKAEVEDRKWIGKILIKYWSSVYIVTRGKLHKADEFKALIAWYNHRRTGLLVYLNNNSQSEIISLSSEIENMGIACRLLDYHIKLCSQNNYQRIKLITTNDNLKALGFYQKRGFVLSNIYINAVNEISRKLKPEIPFIGINEIPIRDEIELEYKL